MMNFILGTDWWTDCDDAVAIRILMRAHLRGDICVRVIAVNACMPVSISSLDAFLRSEGVSDMPLGLDSDATDFGGRPPYQQRLSTLYPDLRRNEDAENAVRLYRRLIAECDGDLDIIEIGYPQVLAAVLSSESDDISPLSGVDLVREKVRRLWVMAGKWNENPGRENNFTRGPRSRLGGSQLCALCPVPITFLGWEAGRTVISGGELSSDDVLRAVLRDHGSEKGRYSWDPMLVQLAITGDEKRAGYSVVRGYAEVDAETGENSFREAPDGPHGYVVKNMPDEWYVKQINDAI